VTVGRKPVGVARRSGSEQYRKQVQGVGKRWWWLVGSSNSRRGSLPPGGPIVTSALTSPDWVTALIPPQRVPHRQQIEIATRPAGLTLAPVLLGHGARRLVPSDAGSGHSTE
jgi:hypothetical protein